MATRVERVRVRGYVWGGDRRPPAGRAIGTLAPLLVLALLTGGVTLARSAPQRTVTVPLDTTTGGAGATGPVRLGSAASVIAAALGPGGSGLGFFAVQRTTEYARPGGITIAVPDPADDRKVIGQTDHLFINAMMSRGVVRADGFFMDMRLGSDTAASPADFAAAHSVFSVLARDGATWRNDGAGWYATAALPGMGIDLATVGLLPRALGHVGSLAAAGTTTLNGTVTSAFTGSVALADYPGAVAADGAAFTDPAIAVKVWVDAANRPVQLWIRARNTNQPDYDLISETTITFDFAPTAILPLPDPTMAPEPSLPPDPASSTTAP